MLFLPQPTADGNRLFSRNTVNGKADRSQCKSQNVTQKPTSHLQRLTSCVSLPPTSIRPSGQKPRHQPRHLPSSLMSHIQPFTMSCLLHVPKRHSLPFPSSPSPPPWSFTVAQPHAHRTVSCAQWQPFHSSPSVCITIPAAQPGPQDPSVPPAPATSWGTLTRPLLAHVSHFWTTSTEGRAPGSPLLPGERVKHEKTPRISSQQSRC